MTTKDDCIKALRRAARTLDASPTKAQYEELGYTPASATIIRTFGSWNAAKEAAELETYEQSPGGNEPAPKPADVELSDEEWNALSGNQRWYHKNREAEIEKKNRRRARLQRWLYEYKRDECACARCGESDPACLDFHHVDEKNMGIAEMVMYGYSVDKLEAEIDQCLVLCANCHRREHYTVPDSVD